MNLILLVGTNPLPNYVTALYFEKDIKALYLVHSATEPGQPSTTMTTKTVADNLAKYLKKNTEITNIEMVSLQDVANKKIIDMSLDNNLATKIATGQPVHLNYTGGTKAMAVHVYTYVNSKFKSNLTCSYLDSRTGRMVFDDGTRNSEDLRHTYKVDMKTMLGLHGYSKCRKPNKLTINTSKISETLDSMVQSEKIMTLLKLRFYLRIILYCDVDKVFKNCDDLECYISNERVLPWIAECNDVSNKNELSELMKCMEDIPLFELDGDKWSLRTKFDGSTFKSAVKELVYDFLDGKWLEDYVAGILTDCKEENDDVGFSLMPVREGKSNNDLELDAYVIRGHELTGISVTTGDSKLKAFELMHRVRQIGGDESRGILICNEPQEKVNTITKTIKSALANGDQTVNFEAFGIDSWKKSELEKIFRRFIWRITE